MCAGKTASRHTALPYVNAWNTQASDDVRISIQEKSVKAMATVSDGSNTRSWSAACGLHEGQAGAKLYLYRGYHKHKKKLGLKCKLIIHFSK